MSSWTSARSRDPAGGRAGAGEKYAHGERIRTFVVVSVRRGPKGPQIGLSRTHPNLVRKLFALEVPEVADGSVEIAALAREAGHRTKIAVHSKVPGLGAKGACIGPMGSRVRAVMAELRGEKIDIVDYSETRPPSSPPPSAPPGSTRSKSSTRSPSGPGHRPRLPAVPRHRPRGPECPAAAKLTGWRIDIRPDNVTGEPAQPHAVD